MALNGVFLEESLRFKQDFEKHDCQFDILAKETQFIQMIMYVDPHSSTELLNSLSQTFFRFASDEDMFSLFHVPK